MKKPWPVVELKVLVAPVERPVAPVLGNIYRQIGVRLWGMGAYERPAIDGGNTGYKTLSKVETDDIVVNKIWARNGSVSVVPEELSGSYVSGEFPTFTIKPHLLEPKWFYYYTKTKAFWTQCDEKSQGTSGKNRIRPEKFLEIPIPLPPLPEQRKIVVQIEKIESKFQETMRIRESRDKLLGSCYDSIANQIFSSAQMQKYCIKLGKAVEEGMLFLNKEARNPQSDGRSEEFLYVDISSVERGPGMINAGNRVKSIEAPSRARKMIRQSDVIFSTVRPNLRAIAKIGKDLDDQICSTGFAVFTCGKNILPDFLLYQLSSGYFINQCITRGGHYPAINDVNLRKTSLIVPPLDIQRKTISTLAAIAALQKKIGVENEISNKKLDALMPAILDKAFKGEL